LSLIHHALVVDANNLDQLRHGFELLHQTSQESRGVSEWVSQTAFEVQELVPSSIST